MCGPGAKGTSARVVEVSLAEEGNVFKRGRAVGTCMTSALANAVDRKCGGVVARRVEGALKRCEKSFE